MNNKRVKAVAIVCLSLITFSNGMEHDIAVADNTQYTQTLRIPNPDILKRVESFGFNRGEYKIIELRPWLKKENQEKQLSEKEINSILNKVGFSGKSLEMAKAIIFLESTNRPYAFNKSSNCYGLFQINMTGSLGTNRLEKYGLSKNEDLFNPVINASIAYQMSNGGKNWSAWTTQKAAVRIVNSSN